MTKLGILLVQHLGVQRLRFVLAIFLLVFTGGGSYSIDALRRGVARTILPIDGR